MRRVATSCALGASLFLLAFAAYMSNGETISSFDNAPNTLLVFNTIVTGQLDFDDYRNSYFAKLGGQYAFVESPSGHLSSVFPIGSAILTTPIAVVYWLVERPSAEPPSEAFEPTRLEFDKLAAALVAAAAVVLFFLCASEIGSRFQAVVGTTVFTFATPMWSIASQSLWPQGPVNVALLVVIYALQRAGRASNRQEVAWILVAGVFAGFLPVIRPSTLFYSAAALVLVALYFRKEFARFLLAMALGCAPGVVWNLFFFHAIAGGYSSNLFEYSANLGNALQNLAGLAFSPSRGLFIFSPILLFAIPGALRAWRYRTLNATIVLSFAVAGLVTALQYAFFRQWWGGFVYGPRFLTDTVAIAALLIVFVVPKSVYLILASRRSTAMTAAFCVAFLVSLFVQFVGANGGAGGSEWNAIPVSIDRDPTRLWQLRDSQIERNVRGAYVRFFPPTSAPESSARVTSLQLPANAGPNDLVQVAATVQNAGPSPLFGYRSGHYVGQIRLLVSATASGTVVSSTPLFVADTIPVGGTGYATGWLPTPHLPGAYELTCAWYLVGNQSDIRQTNAQATLVIR